MVINQSKCNIISFYKSYKNPLINEYHLDNKLINRVNQIKDLGVTFDSRLTFEHHITETVQKCNRVHGFVLRSSKPFHSLDLTLTLYNSLVRSVLEYNSIIWYPHQEYLRNKIERIQKKLTNVLFYRFNNFYPTYPNNIAYRTLCEMLQLPTLSARSEIAQMIFIFKMMNNQIDTDVSENIGLRVPLAKLRPNSGDFFSTSSPNAILINSLQTLNKYYTHCNLDLSSTLRKFKSVANSLVNNFT